MSEARKKIFEKIKKCLALSSSSNEHEAEAALRQARALMDMHGIDDQGMLAYEAGEHHTKAGAQINPANWESGLVIKVGDAFGCKVIFSPRWNEPAKWKFIGCGAAPEVAAYAFHVLHRQCKRARAEYITTRLKRCKQATKTRRADLFCNGWIHAVAGKIAALSGNERRDDAIEAYMVKNYPSLSKLQSRDRNDGRSLRGHECNDLSFGIASGRNAELNRGVGGAAPIGLGRS